MGLLRLRVQEDCEIKLTNLQAFKQLELEFKELELELEFRRPSSLINFLRFLRYLHLLGPFLHHLVFHMHQHAGEWELF